MNDPAPITWNGLFPRSARADPLWDVLSGILVLVADRGERIRWRSKPTDIGLEVHLLVNNTWFEMVPPLWKMQHLINRLVRLASRNWWDSWSLWRAARRYAHLGEPLVWERPITIGCHGEMLSAVCRVECIGVDEKVEIDVAQAAVVTSTAAAASVREFVERVPFSEMAEKFL
jgi:hypothetical protein